MKLFKEFLMVWGILLAFAAAIAAVMGLILLVSILPSTFGIPITIVLVTGLCALSIVSLGM
jgi:hypothetical protein